jgi:hypothetical protein
MKTPHKAAANKPAAADGAPTTATTAKTMARSIKVKPAWLLGPKVRGRRAEDEKEKRLKSFIDVPLKLENREEHRRT